MPSTTAIEAPPVSRSPGDPEPGRAPQRSVGHSREEEVLDACECMIDSAAALFNVSGRELRRPGRTANDVARVRQIAMYVAHVALGLSMNEVGKGFGRDRTTVLHACHVIEDLRDDADFDRVISVTERVARAAFRKAEER